MKKLFKNTLALMLAAIMTLSPVTLTAYAVSVGDMKSKLISVAENEIGYTERPGNQTKYGDWYGYQGPWCTTFVLWCFNQTGEKLGVKLYGKIVPSGGNCNSMISWYKNKGRYHTRSSGYTPKKGDLIFFDWSGNGSSQHVGIVKSVSGSTVYTIEGNCSGKVKAKTYTPSGSKPYKSTSSIMGYGSPDWSSVANGKSETTTKKKATTTKKQETATKKASTKKKKSKKSTTKKSTTKKASTKKSTAKKATTTKKATNTATTTTKPTKATTKRIVAKDMELHTATTTLEVGDSVDLRYTVKPKGAEAVVGYFCDEEGVIEIGEGGVITATGEGTATVVVCANDEIYRQCSYTVTEASACVTQHSPDRIEVETSGGLNDKSLNQKLTDIGINADNLKSHAQYFIYPAAIMGATAVIALLITAVKAVARVIRKKKDGHVKD
ncbi:MAG: CHAP domain-containing protein [Ruminococcaceae bacterium]|nr:CHAP domain-containing protein [Oscillospiraceae bacterium]